MEIEIWRKIEGFDKYEVSNLVTACCKGRRNTAGGYKWAYQ